MTFDQAHVTVKNAMFHKVNAMVQYADEDRGFEVGVQDHDDAWSYFYAYSAALDCIEAVRSGR